MEDTNIVETESSLIKELEKEISVESPNNVFGDCGGSSYKGEEEDVWDD